MIPGTLHIYNFSARVFDLTFEPDSGKRHDEPYRIAGMERLQHVAIRLGIALSEEDTADLLHGKHLKKACELEDVDYRMFFQ